MAERRRSDCALSRGIGNESGALVTKYNGSSVRLMRALGHRRYRCDTFGHLLTLKGTRHAHPHRARRRSATAAFYKSDAGDFIASQITLGSPHTAS